MLTRIGKQSGGIVESVPKKKKKAAVGRICKKKEKEGFKPGMKEWGGDGILKIISIPGKC